MDPVTAIDAGSAHVHPQHQRSAGLCLALSRGCSQQQSLAENQNPGYNSLMSVQKGIGFLFVAPLGAFWSNYNR
jgi:hypothetical protein